MRIGDEVATVEGLGWGGMELGGGVRDCDEGVKGCNGGGILKVSEMQLVELILGLDTGQDSDVTNSANSLDDCLRLILGGVRVVLFDSSSRATYDITGVGEQGKESLVPILCARLQ
jgi:hypothetical protein